MLFFFWGCCCCHLRIEAEVRASRTGSTAPVRSTRIPQCSFSPLMPPKTKFPRLLTLPNTGIAISWANPPISSSLSTEGAYIYLQDNSPTGEIWETGTLYAIASVYFTCFVYKSSYFHPLIRAPRRSRRFLTGLLERTPGCRVSLSLRSYGRLSVQKFI